MGPFKVVFKVGPGTYRLSNGSTWNVERLTLSLGNNNPGEELEGMYPLSNLYPPQTIICEPTNNDNGNVERPEVEEPYRTRSGRLVKRPKRYGNEK